MSRLSTHILDISKGVPAQEVVVILHTLKENSWSSVEQGITNENGRLEFTQTSALSQGTYKLEFRVKEYFQKLDIQSIFPYIEVAFEVSGPIKLHIPLLLSPFGYSTYRGS